MTDQELQELLGGIRTPTAQALERLLRWAWAHKGYLPYISAAQLERVGGILHRTGPKPSAQKTPKKVYRKTNQKRRRSDDPMLIAEKAQVCRRCYARGYVAPPGFEGYPPISQPEDPLTWRVPSGKVYRFTGDGKGTEEVK